MQSFWAAVVGGLLDDPNAAAKVERPDDEELLALLEEESARFLKALQDRDPSDECWSWHETGYTVG